MLYGKIFDIIDGEIVINEFILTIPVLRAVKDAYTDPMPAFKFLRNRYDLESPYASVPEEEIEEQLLKDFPGEYTLEDLPMRNALEYFENKRTPIQRFFTDSKLLLEKMGVYGRNATLEAGRDGNISAMQRQLSSVGKTITEFKALQKIVEEEIAELKQNKNRGGHDSSYDEDK
jgi:hypothetical protein